MVTSVHIRKNHQTMSRDFYPSCLGREKYIARFPLQRTRTKGVLQLVQNKGVSSSSAIETEAAKLKIMLKRQ